MFEIFCFMLKYIQTNVKFTVKKYIADKTASLKFFQKIKFKTNKSIIA